MSDETHRQLDWFKAFARSGRAPRWTMGPADLHGFLTGLAMSGALSDAAWTNWVWSGETPQFASEREEWNVMNELHACASRVRRGLGAYRILTASVLPQAGSGWFFAADWAEGFLQAIEARPQPWQKVVDLAETSLSLVLGTCYHNHDTLEDGLIDLNGLDEINFHLRHLNRIMQTAADQPVPLKRAA